MRWRLLAQVVFWNGEVVPHLGSSPEFRAHSHHHTISILMVY